MPAEQWFNDYAGAVYSYILMQVRNRHTAEELTQETFMKVVEKVHQFEGKAAAKTWIFRIAYTTTMNHYRKKHPLTHYLDRELPLLGTQPSSEETAILSEQEAEFYEALRRLRKSHQQVIMLRHIQGFSTKDTAAILGSSEGKVKMSLKRALDAFKSELEKGGMSRDTLHRR
ncbi:RNA polymerase subunit sigma [Sporosarcina sp. NCCP-2716]|uniref:RNA polymerase sigma factor n=1 Tax=Sporosarcina sp. NCCP-2716 TaxID=2943679 RepID=UPI00204184B6|nr:sigma-70 family RNA polymerase sigma factor [Sporosarcina sp. NCCP-2716]GKV70145.1 RNA polymerase subunit sigma [Sporosarcina sp. NCCP-2716]